VTAALLTALEEIIARERGGGAADDLVVAVLRKKARARCVLIAPSSKPSAPTSRLASRRCTADGWFRIRVQVESVVGTAEAARRAWEQALVDGVRADAVRVGNLNLDVGRVPIEALGYYREAEWVEQIRRHVTTDDLASPPAASAHCRRHKPAVRPKRAPSKPALRPVRAVGAAGGAPGRADR
jgi:hypothetical protein